MHSRLDEAKQELLIEAAATAEHRRGAGVLSPDETLLLLKKYYAHVAPEDILERTPADVYGAAVSHYRLAASRPQGTATVRVFTPTIDENEWAASGHSVVEVVTDDMPFLVDSLSMELNRHNHTLHSVIHPQLLVRRDITGRLLEVCDAEQPAGDDPQDGVRESWMHIEIDRVGGTTDLEEVEQELSRVLRDVREVVEDWQKMHTQAMAIVEELGDQPSAAAPAGDRRRAARCSRGWPRTTSRSSATASTS